MLLTITTTAAPATDLGYLLYKHPDRVTRFDQSYGAATVYFPQATDDRCTAAILLDVDPVKLRGKKTPDFSLGQYVNDRPYVASSLLAVAIGKVFRTARTGRCDQRQELADTPIPLALELPAVPCRGGEAVARKLFEPLGWTVTATAIPLHPDFPQWGASRYLRLRLTGTIRLADALNHLYVLLPVLDDAKHYWIDIAEVDKLVRNGEGWLERHPARNLITRRYLGHRRGLHRVAHARLAELEEVADDLETPIDEESGDDAQPAAESATPKKPLASARIEAVIEALNTAKARDVIDLGCGSGKLLAALLADTSFRRIAGADVSTYALRIAARSLRLDHMPRRQTERIELFQAALTYEDDRFSGYDAAVLMEVVEHIDPPRLPALEQVVFGAARPKTVIVTTPNREYNRVYGMPDGSMRHPDHRFEWDRDEFTRWAQTVATGFGYRVAIAGVGDEDTDTGQPTQIGVFTRD